MRPTPIILLLFLLGAYHLDAQELAYNLAKAILRPDHGEFVAAISKKWYDSESEMPPALLNFHKEIKSLEVLRRFSAPFYISELDYSTCEEQPQEQLIIYLHPFDPFAKEPYVSFNLGTSWIVILKTMYNRSGQSLNDSVGDHQYFEEILRYKFVNPKTFFQVPTPTKDNVVFIKTDKNYGLKTFPDQALLKKGQTPPAGITISDENIIEDISVLNSLHSKGNATLLEKLQGLQAILPKLKTEIGQQIAHAGIDLFKEELIKQAFPPSTPEGVAKKLCGRKDAALKQMRKQSENADFTPKSDISTNSSLERTP